MKLSEWLVKENKTVADMARDLGLSHTVVLRWTNGSRIPAKDFMQRVVSYTKGEVQPNDFYEVANEQN